MKAKLLLFAILLIVVFSVAANVMAMTETERQALILQIQQQIAQLYAQIAQLQGTQTSGTWCHTFNTNLGFAQSGTAEVGFLHVALQKQNISYGSDGINEYTNDTVTAVSTFQAKYGITPTSGYVGEKTRAKLNQLYSCENISTTCIENWQCGAWSVCANGTQTKSCYDVNTCGTTIIKPNTTQSCVVACTENWQCGNWSTCAGGTQTKTCTDANKCGTTINRPNTTQSCTASCSPDWDCTEWSTCLSGNKTRTCTDVNTCGITAGKPTESQSCNSSVCTPNWSCTSWTACVNGTQAQTCTDINNCGVTTDKPLESRSCLPTCRYLMTPNHYDSEWYLDAKGYKITSGSCDNGVSYKHYCQGGVEKESVLTCPLGCTVSGLGGFCFSGVKFTYPADASQAIWIASNDNTITWDYAGIDGSARANLVFTDWTSGISETHNVALSDKQYIIRKFSPAYPGQDPPAGRTFKFSISSADPGVSNFDTRPEYAISIIQSGWTYLSGLPSQVKNGQFDSDRGADFYTPGKLYLFTNSGLGSSTMKTYYPDVCSNGMMYEKNCYLPATTPNSSTKLGCVLVQGDQYLFQNLNKNPYPCPFGCSTDGAACKNPNCPQVTCLQDLCPGKHVPGANGCMSCSSPCQSTFPGEQLGTLPAGF